MKRTFDFAPTPLELAKEFATWSSEDQAAFLEHVRRIFVSWGACQKDMQVLGVGHALRDHWPETAQLVRDLAADAEDA